MGDEKRIISLNEALKISTHHLEVVNKNLRSLKELLPPSDIGKTASWKNFFEYCGEVYYATLIIKVDVVLGQPLQFEVLEEHRKFRQDTKCEKHLGKKEVV